jgi:hypothetical protein
MRMKREFIIISPVDLDATMTHMVHKTALHKGYPLLIFSIAYIFPLSTIDRPSNDTAASRQLNRRVGIILSGDNGNIAPR